MKEEYTKLLNRQIKVHFKGRENIPDDLKPFIKMVDDAYIHYDTDRDLLERSMEISTRELEGKNQKLKENNEALDDFNHSVSHDLKTHAVNTISLVKMLSKYFEKENFTKLATIISKLESTGEQFQKVINGFLEVSKFEQDLDDIKSSIIVKDLFAEIADEFKLLIGDREAYLNCKIENVTSIYFIREQLMSIIRNLITNSLKYSRSNVPAQIDLQISKLNSTDCRITVRDNGIGIDMKKNKHRLFKMFTRLENNLNVEGTGVGLFLVKKLLDKNGASIKVESELGLGTTFIIDLKKVM